MKRVSSDAFRVLLYFIGTFLLAALIAPWLYQAGKALAEMVQNKDTNDLISWLGKSAGKADFAKYFKRSVALAGLLLLPVLIFSLRMSARRRIDDGPWSLHLPKHSIAFYDGQKLEKNPHKFLHLVVGFLLAAVFLLLFGYMAISAEIFIWKESIDWPKAFRKAITPAIFTSCFEEVFFRGALLGIFIRCLGPWRGAVILSAIFALVHFLIPPRGMAIEDPTSVGSGLHFLALVCQRFVQPEVFFGGFLTLFIVGLILSYARIRTASLWLPIGLHMGWVFAFKIFHRATQVNPDNSMSRPFLVGNELRSGLLVILALGVTAALIKLFLYGMQREGDSPAETGGEGGK